MDSHEEHLQIVDYLYLAGRPAVIITANGVAAGGTLVNHLKRMPIDECHDVLFISCQAEHPAGRAIQRRGPRGGWVPLGGERIDIHAGVRTIGGYSAHADQTTPLGFIRGTRQPPEKIHLGML